MNPAVITNLYGGLGNQLFQYAATLTALQKVHGSEFELLFYEGHEVGADIADFIDVPVRRPTRSDRARWQEFAVAGGPLRPAFRLTSRLHERFSRRRVITASSPFEGVPDLRSGDQVKLAGFFQNPEWYATTIDGVVDALLARAPTGFSALADKKPLVVHLRRTDYIRAKWDLPPSYYLRVLDAMGFAGKTVTVVTDDVRFVPWFAEAMSPLGCTFTEPAHLSDSPAHNDFWNVAASAGIVMANSTFSWWASVVAMRSADVRVAYPQPWIVNRWSGVTIPDLGLPGWEVYPSGLPE